MPEDSKLVTIDLETFKRDLAHSFDNSLKAELAQMELRLVRTLSESMAHKADAAVVTEMDKRLRQRGGVRVLAVTQPGRRHIGRYRCRVRSSSPPQHRVSRLALLLSRCLVPTETLEEITKV